MKSTSRILLLLALLALGGSALASDGLFSTVPAGDATYAQLKRLEDLGLLPQGAAKGSLTRYEVAQLIFRARGNYDALGVRVAQVDDIPPPPESMESASDASSASASSSAPVATGPREIDPTTGNTTSSQGGDVTAPSTAPAATAAEAAPVLDSLEGAYQYELKSLKDDAAKAAERAQKAEKDQFSLWKRLRSLETGTAIYLHGLGRGYTRSDNVKGDVAGAQRDHVQGAFIDLMPTGIVSKEIRWGGTIRVQSDVVPPNTADIVTLRKAFVDYNPAWISTSLGYFEESFTPLTLWNRPGLDLKYKPSILARQEAYDLYETYREREGYLPFHGVRFANDLFWPKSNSLETLRLTAFASILNHGWDKAYVVHRYTQWVFGGRAAFKARKYFSVDLQGLMLDEPLDTDDPTSAYLQFDPATWAQNYKTGSVRPRLEYEASLDLSVGAQYELAYSIYQDDKRDDAKKVEDYARLGGPFVRYKKARLQVNMVDVGPAYYAPLAQVRQVNDFDGSQVGFPFSTGLGRPSQHLLYYSRYADNVFPYGFSTPNRKGVGAELETKALEKDALTLKLAFYKVKEGTGNLVPDSSFSEFVPVDGDSNSPAAMRDFTYINAGPSLNIAPLLDLSRQVEIGFNYRSEKTESRFGELKSNGFMGGVKAGVTGWLEVSAYGSSMKTQGSEATLGGSGLARTPYVFDNTDLGGYTVDLVDMKTTTVALDAAFLMNRNSKLVAEGYTTKDQKAWPDAEIATEQTQAGWRMVYEIEF